MLDGYMYRCGGERFHPSYSHIRTNWEIVGNDKDWNWAEAIPIVSFKARNDAKKCRDLILDDLDLQSEDFMLNYRDVVAIVKKRFGDL